MLTTGRTLHQFNAGTMTMRTPNAALRPRDMLDMSPADAAHIGLREGDMVVIRSRHGTATLPLHMDGRVQPGEVFATFHTPSLLLNRVIGQGRDAHTSTPEYKVTAVRVKRAESPKPG
ncbi:MAG: molybdopterin dinucleotide binding domain-containing protein [Terriglobales bacterium]